MYARNDSQGVPSHGELFILCIALYKMRIDNVVHILSHLEASVSYPTKVIATRGVIIAIAMGLRPGDTLETLGHLYIGGLMNLSSYILQQLFIYQEEELYLNHHDRPLFALPNKAKTTIQDTLN